ncbi:hypothetical protein NGM10_03075 [Halorussus salilacus]|uniref:DUF7315 family membrane protein n=1 Tax=Halorussus salilacus TaxID=2953750 RepID=UPI00209FC3CD|nr:hypothetical protein [Halorussus salilacus]USZ68728.1 hypothetical protein NGM10_03075 [Halorussus salilacus]
MDSSTDDADTEGETRAREVVVPLRLYKVVTVFSTMFAVAFVVGGFVVLDTATQRASLDIEEINVPLAVLGVAMIVAGSVVYAFSTRFRAEGMGKPKDGSDEPSNNG